MYSADLPNDVAQRVIRTKLWLKGHTFDEIDNLSLNELGDILGFEDENAKADKKLAERSKKLKSKLS